MLEHASLAVIIVSWNVSELLDRSLTSLRRELKCLPMSASVWVLDNASEDGTAATVKENHAWVHLIESEENLGYVRGNNVVIRRLLDGEPPEYLWLLNPDTWVHPQAVERLVSLMVTHPKAGMVGPKLLNPDGSRQTCAFRFPGLLQPLFDLGLMPERFYHSRLNGRYPDGWFARGEPFQIDHPLGAALLARTEAVQEVGLLDPQFFMYCEEIDWAWRMRRLGWQAWLVPEAEVTHVGGASTRQARPQTTCFLWESRAKLYAKHRGVLMQRVVGGLVRRVFRRRLVQAHDPDWIEAYNAILDAWRLP